MGIRQLWAVTCAGAVVVLATGAGAADITGAGATFPYPVYAKWAEAYKAKTGVGMNYQSIGSGGGIKQIQNKTVDFGASDMPLKPEELDKDGLMQFPTVIGGDVPVVNLEGVKPGELKLTGPVLADIYLGKITKWNDAAIAKLNPGSKLPDSEITVVHRSDGSGTTFIWVNYLSKVSPEWKEKVGEGTSVAWPAGVGGKGNEGVASYVQRVKGSIGYVEYAYALQNKMTYAQVQNRDGAFVSPSAETFKAAAVRSRLEQGARILPRADRPARQEFVADIGRDLHSDVQDSGQAGQCPRGAEVLRLRLLIRWRQARRLTGLRPTARHGHESDQVELEVADEGYLGQAGLLTSATDNRRDPTTFADHARVAACPKRVAQSLARDCRRPAAQRVIIRERRVDVHAPIMQTAADAMPGTIASSPSRAKADVAKMPRAEAPHAQSAGR